MDLEQLRARCEARAEALGLPHRFSTRDLRDAVAELRGRPVILRPLSTLGAVDAPCGIRLETPDADLLFHEEATSPLHQNQILAHEISHILCDHPGSLELDQDTLRAIGFDPTLVRRMSGRTSYTSEDEREAEVMASVIRRLMYRGRESPPSRPASGAESWDALFTLTAATSVLAFLFQLNLERERARRQIRLRVLTLGACVAAMTAFFAAEQFTGRSPALYACYVLVYISYLGYTAKDFLLQTWAQSGRSARRSQRWGLRTTSVGCGFALVYAAYKLFALVSIGLGPGLVPDHARCSTPLTPLRCAFSVTAPAVSVLLITAGLALPALLWPLSRLRRRRWERNSFDALEPLWREVTSAVPEVVLDPGGTGADSQDLGFHLHRRVIEINDCVLALRRYRQVPVQEAAAAEAARRGTAGTPGGDAEVEAAVVAAAVEAKRSGLPLGGEEAPPAAGTRSRKGDLPAETAWLLLVAAAHARRPAAEHAGAAS
ncbi:MAB_1171c family putative transporter [Streptomyces sp. NBC_00158]|uniref:MAB_1171c family putative transporter n=1 Tax=Streptomyces sp. NBC_00158 TaxID=2903627 RepID=UPI0032537B46